MIRCFCIVCVFSFFRFVFGFFFERRCVDSGHGGQTKDLDGDEADGWDEGTFLISL